MLRLGIFGGTFDPIHYGHLWLAETCREQACLEEVWFVPAAVSPFKREHPPSEAKHRVEMLKLAVGGHEPFRLSQCEIERGGTSYTVDTLEHFHREFPQAELFFLMGADALRDFASWREPERICQLATPLVVRRQGAPEPNLSALVPLLPAERLERVRTEVVEMPVIELSSTEIRQRVAEGKSIRYQVPRAVEMYIETHKLYR